MCANSATEQAAGCSSGLPTPAAAEQGPAAGSPQAREPEPEGCPPASEALPWQASFLMKYVRQCLELLAVHYPQCAPIQTRTRAAEMAVALFRWGPPAAGSWGRPRPCPQGRQGTAGGPPALAHSAQDEARLRSPRAGGTWWPLARALAGPTLGHCAARRTPSPSAFRPPRPPLPPPPPPPCRRVYLRRSKLDRATLLREVFLAQALLAAALWVAVKFEANRSATPDSNIMWRITGGC